MTLNIGMVGCGKWGKKVADEIEKHKDFKLKSIHILEALNIYTVQKQEYGQLLMLFTIAEKF